MNGFEFGWCFDGKGSKKAGYSNGGHILIPAIDRDGWSVPAPQQGYRSMIGKWPRDGGDPSYAFEKGLRFAPVDLRTPEGTNYLVIDRKGPRYVPTAAGEESGDNTPIATCFSDYVDRAIDFAFAWCWPGSDSVAIKRRLNLDAPRETFEVRLDEIAVLDRLSARRVQSYLRNVKTDFLKEQAATLKIPGASKLGREELIDQLLAATADPSKVTTTTKTKLLGKSNVDRFSKYYACDVTDGDARISLRLSPIGKEKIRFPHRRHIVRLLADAPGSRVLDGLPREIALLDDVDLDGGPVTSVDAERDGSLVALVKSDALAGLRKGMTWRSTARP